MSLVMEATGETFCTAGIQISPAGIKPMTGNLVTLVNTEEITEIIVRYGFRSAHPVIQLALGAVLSLLPLYSVARMLFWSSEGGTLYDGEVLLLTSGIIGVWLLVDAFSRGYYLVVVTPRGKHRMALNKKTPVHVVMTLCQQLHDRKFKVFLKSPYDRHLPTGPFSPA